MDSKWCGAATIQSINMFSGWGPGFLGIHETIREIYQVELNVKFVHPLDDPLVVEELKKTGMSVDHIKTLKIMGPTTSLRITGNAAISGFSENTHETKEYCMECSGKDGTWKKDLPKIVIPVSGNVNLAKNEIDFDFGDLPKGYNVGLSHWFPSKNVKLAGSDKIVFNYKYNEENVIDQNLTGELYKIKHLKKIFPKDIKPNEPIKTDKKTRLEIDWKDVGKIDVAENTQGVIKCSSVCWLELSKGKIHSVIKKIRPKTKFEVMYSFRWKWNFLN